MSVLPAADMGPVAVRIVLLVGDEEDIESELRSIFAPSLWAIQHARDNATALVMAHVKNFDLIVTSGKTSGREDIALLRKIRLIRPHTRLIILTSESTPSDVISSMREHAFSYFSRPFSPGALNLILLRAIQEPCWDDGIEVISATPQWIRLSVRCDLRTADRVLQFLDEIAELPDLERNAVGIAFREMLINAMQHGAAFDPSQSVEISYLQTRHMVSCRISDPGEGFTLDEIPHAAIANPRDDPLRHLAYRDGMGMRPGGFGVLVAQQLLDELIYNEQGNEVVLVKYLDLEPKIKPTMECFP